MSRTIFLGEFSGSYYYAIQEYGSQIVFIARHTSTYHKKIYATYPCYFYFTEISETFSSFGGDMCLIEEWEKYGDSYKRAAEKYRKLLLFK